NQLFREMARYDTALFLNNDVVVRANPACLMAMMEALDATPKAGIAGLVMFFGDGTTVQHAGIDFFRGGPLHGLCFHPGSREKKRPGDFTPLRPVAAVTGACLMIRSGLFEGLGGFEEAYAAEAQDVDLCLKARRLGQRTLLLQAGSILHLENATRPQGEENWADRRLFIRRWGSFIDTVFPEALLP
ncbi:MAG: hypothetical protein K2Q10_01255, partial [Rhodospirillales bacterium]|nr:hypothetical protein [Rhodospirillales bacterium]